LLVVLAAPRLACSDDAQATGVASSSTATHAPSQSEGDTSAATTSVPDSLQRSWAEQYCAALKTFVYPDPGPATVGNAGLAARESSLATPILMLLAVAFVSIARWRTVRDAQPRAHHKYVGETSR